MSDHPKFNMEKVPVVAQLVFQALLMVVIEGLAHGIIIGGIFMYITMHMVGLPFLAILWYVPGVASAIRAFGGFLSEFEFFLYQMKVLILSMIPSKSALQPPPKIATVSTKLKG